MGTKLARRSLFQGIGAVVFAKALERLPLLPEYVHVFVDGQRYRIERGVQSAQQWVLDRAQLVRSSRVVVLAPSDTLCWVGDVAGYALTIVHEQRSRLT